MELAGILKPIPWETRNLERPAYEISEEFVEQPDKDLLLSALAEIARRQDPFFVQARVKNKSSAAIRVLEMCGFSYAETTLQALIRLHGNPAMDAFTKDDRVFSPRRKLVDAITTIDLDRANSEHCSTVRSIARQMFFDDRFHLDPQCSGDTADRRYEMWVGDMLADPEVNFVLGTFKGEIIGFLCFKGPDLYLGGIVPDHSAKGLGTYFWVRIFAGFRSRGYTLMRTRVSATNLGILNLYVRVGARFQASEIVFHFWGNRA